MPIVLSQWITNASAHFVRGPDITVDYVLYGTGAGVGAGVGAGEFKVHVPRDTMVTVTTTTGQKKGEVTDPAAKAAGYEPFPFPYSTSYDSIRDVVNKPAVYHADNEGTFEIQPALPSAGSSDRAGGSSNNNLMQMVPIYPMYGYGDVDPITSLGASDWSNYGIKVHVQIVSPPPPYAMPSVDPFLQLPDPVTFMMKAPSPSYPPPGWGRISNDTVGAGAYAGICVRLLVRYSGTCLLVGAGLTGAESGGVGWQLVNYLGTTGCRATATTVVAQGGLTSFNLSEWHGLSLEVLGATATANIDGSSVYRGTIIGPSNEGGAAGSSLPSAAGLASLRSGYHYSRFDNLSIFQSGTHDGISRTRSSKTNPRTSAWPNVLFDKHLLSPPAPYPGGKTAAPVMRNDMDGEVGCAFTAGKKLQVVALGRFASAGEANGSHNLTLYRVANSSAAAGIVVTPMASVTVDLSKTAGDLNGYAWAAVATNSAALLEPGQKYIIASTESKGGDYWADSITRLQARPDVLSGYASPAYKSDGKWTEVSTDHDTGYIGGACYGPLNAETVAT
jgi:hypothetical protein